MFVGALWWDTIASIDRIGSIPGLVYTDDWEPNINSAITGRAAAVAGWTDRIRPNRIDGTDHTITPSSKQQAHTHTLKTTNNGGEHGAYTGSQTPR